MRDWLRRYLGTRQALNHLADLEERMSEITDALNRLAEQTNAVSAAQATSFSNLQAAINDLKAGKLSPEQQEIVTRIENSLTKLGDDAQRADDGYEQVPDVDPGDEQPTDPNGQPVTDPQGDVLPQDGTGR